MSHPSSSITFSGIVATLVAQKKQVRQFGVKKLGVFGSVARGEAKADSDLDFVVVLEKKTFDDYMGLKLFLEELFHRRIDLVLESAIKAQLRENIMRETIYVQGL